MGCDVADVPYSVAHPARARRVGVVVGCAYVAYVVASIAVYRRLQRRRLFPLTAARAHVLVVLSSCAGLVFLAMSALRDAVGWRRFPCGLYVFLAMVAIPLYTTPLVLRAIVLRFRYTWAQTVRGTVLSEPLDAATIRKLLQLKKRLTRRWALAVSALLWGGSVVFALLVVALLPGAHVRGAAGWSKCRPCGLAAGHRLALGLEALFFGGCLVLAMARSLLEHDDAHGIKRELVLCSLFCVIFAGADLAISRGGRRDGAYGARANGWYLGLVCCFLTHSVQVVAPCAYALQHDAVGKFRRGRSASASLGSGATPRLARPSSGSSASSPSSSKRRMSPYEVATPGDDLTMRQLLSSDAGLSAFEAHLAREFAVENLKAWQALRWWQIGMAQLHADEAIRRRAPPGEPEPPEKGALSPTRGCPATPLSPTLAPAPTDASAPRSPSLDASPRLDADALDDADDGVADWGQPSLCERRDSAPPEVSWRTRKSSLYTQRFPTTASRRLYDTFVDVRAPLQINVSARARDEARSRLEEHERSFGDARPPPDDLFTAVLFELERLMETDSFDRFIRSSLWSPLVDAVEESKLIAEMLPFEITLHETARSRTTSPASSLSDASWLASPASPSLSRRK